MHPAPVAPRLHLFVCANRRAAESPLGPGCADGGDAVYAALKALVARHAHVADVWVTRTQCLGICPREGATVAVYPAGTILTEVLPADASPLYARALEGAA